MVVVNRLSKKRKFITLDSIEVEAIIQAFIKQIWRKEGYLNTIISNRGIQFISYFQQRLYQRIGITLKLSTTFHPETDGQIEAANIALKQYLYAYVNYQQDNWVQLLPVAEFEANLSINSSTGIPPFLATKGYILCSRLEPLTPQDKATPRQSYNSITVNRLIE